MATRTEISLKVTEDDAKSEATIFMPNSYPLSDAEQLKDDNYTIDDIITLEHNNWVFSAERSVLTEPETLNWGLWSDELSDEEGYFSSPPILMATTENAYSTSGFTVTFGGDSRPGQTVTTWHSGDSISGYTELATQTDTVSGNTHFVDRNVDGFTRIKVEFVNTTLPCRRVKIAEIDFGQVFVWASNNIMSARVREDVDLTNSTLPINTLDFSLRDDNAEFNMLNPDGVYEYLRQKQKLNVIEYVNGSPRKMGTYYLKTWANNAPVTADFEAQDIIGLFDGITYRSSLMWAGTAFSAVIDSIMSAAGFTAYEIDPVLSDVILSGYIPVVTVREALHQACFSAMASVISRRDGTLLFTRLPSSATVNQIEKSQKYGSQTITQKDLINSVVVNAYKFSPSASLSQLYSSALTPGVYEVAFSAPAMGLTCSGGTITESGINYAVVSVVAAGTVTVSGYIYQPSSSSFTVEAVGLIPSRRSQATIDGIYLISQDNAEAIAQFVFDDYQRRIVQRFTIVVDDENVGDNVDVDTMLGSRKTGVITSMNINLSGGFTAEIEVRG